MKFFYRFSISVLVVGFFLLCCGGVLSFYSTKNKASSPTSSGESVEKPSNDNTDSDDNLDNDSSTSEDNSLTGDNINDLTSEEIDELYDRVHNESPNILQEHCAFSSFCVTNMNITYADEIVVINLNLANNSSEVIESSHLVFDFLDDKEKTVSTEHIDFPTLNPAESTTIQILSTDSKIVNANDYKVRLATEEEVEYYNSLFK